MKKYRTYAKLKRCKVKEFLHELSSTERRNTKFLDRITKYDWVLVDHTLSYHWLRNSYWDDIKNCILVDKEYVNIKTVEILPWYKKIIWYLTSKLTHKVGRNQTQN